MIPPRKTHCRVFMLPFAITSAASQGSEEERPSPEDLARATEYLRVEKANIREGDLVSFYADNPFAGRDYRYYSEQAGLGIIHQGEVIGLDYSISDRAQPQQFLLTDGWPVDYWAQDGHLDLNGIDGQSVAWIKTDQIIEQALQNLTTGDHIPFLHHDYRAAYTWFSHGERKIWIVYTPRYDSRDYLEHVSKRYYAKAIRESLEEERGRIFPLNCLHYATYYTMDCFNECMVGELDGDLILTTNDWPAMDRRRDALVQKVRRRAIAELTRVFDDPDLDRSKDAGSATSLHAIQDHEAGVLLLPKSHISRARKLIETLEHINQDGDYLTQLFQTHGIIAQGDPEDKI